MPVVILRSWLDHYGRLFEAPADARTCGDFAGGPCIHYLWRPDDIAQLQPQTLCGQRAGTIPGNRDVDCPDCLAIDRAGGQPAV